MSSGSSKALRGGFYHMSHQHSHAALYSSISLGQLGTVCRFITTTRQLNGMAGDALLSSHRTINRVLVSHCAFLCNYRQRSREMTHLVRTHSFAIRPRKAKKPRDSNETLQERRGEERGGKWDVSIWTP